MTFGASIAQPLAQVGEMVNRQAGVIGQQQKGRPINLFLNVVNNQFLFWSHDLTNSLKIREDRSATPDPSCWKSYSFECIGPWPPWAAPG